MASAERLVVRVSVDDMLPAIIQALAGLAEGQARLQAGFDALNEALAAEGEQDDDSIDVSTLDGGYERRPAADPLAGL